MSAVAELRHQRIAAIQDLVTALREIPEQFTPEIITRCTPGLMSREMRMSAGKVVVSKVHLSEHQFVIAVGACYVASDTETVWLEAGHVGITKPGTQRVIAAATDLVWVTFHATDMIDPDEFEASVTTDCMALPEVPDA